MVVEADETYRKQIIGYETTDQEGLDFDYQAGDYSDLAYLGSYDYYEEYYGQYNDSNEGKFFPKIKTYTLI